MAFFGMGQPFGFQPMLKEGHKMLSGLDEAVLKNIDACKQLSQITRTSLGPNGMNKIVINHLEKLFVTSDAGTIMNELEVQHPAAKLLVLAAKSQQEEVGDGANLVITLAGELLSGAEELIRSGLHPSEIIAGYNKASNKSLEILESIVETGSEELNVRDKDEVVKRITAVVGSKLFGLESILTPLIVEACIQVCPNNPYNFNIDNVRAVKIVGGGINDCCVVRGLLVKNDTEGIIKQATKAKVAVYGVGVDTTATETKGTVLIESAEQLENYAKTEEDKVEEVIKGIAAAGVRVIVSGSTVGAMALHFCERYKLMVVKISSKFELRRLCRATGAVAMVKFEPPSLDVLGYVDSIATEEIAGENIIVVKNESSGNLLSTIVLRGSTQNILDEAERAVDDGVNTYKALCRDSRVVPGAGATEIEVAKRLKEFGRKETGLDQYAIEKFGDTLEVVPRTLAENAGLNATAIISALYAAHAAGNVSVGVDVEGGTVKDMTKDNIWDLYCTKFWAMRFAADAVKTVLRVDQIVMAKIAGGPKPRQNPGGMDPDE